MTTQWNSKQLLILIYWNQAENHIRGSGYYRVCGIISYKLHICGVNSPEPLQRVLLRSVVLGWILTYQRSSKLVFYNGSGWKFKIPDQSSTDTFCKAMVGTEMGTRLTKRKFRKKEGVTKPKMAKVREVFVSIWFLVISWIYSSTKGHEISNACRFAVFLVYLFPWMLRRKYMCHLHALRRKMASLLQKDQEPMKARTEIALLICHAMGLNTGTETASSSKRDLTSP